MSHSSQPPSPYERSYSFTDNSTSNPTSQQPGQKIDQELNNVRASLNATISRLGEVQADDGHVRNSALNLNAIAEAVEPLLTTAPIQAVNAAGASQVAAVNTAGTTQVANVNAAAAAGAALIAAETTTPNAVLILSAQQQTVIAAQEAQLNAANSLTNRNLTYNLYQQTNAALNDAQIAELHAEGFANSAADAQSAAATEANNALNAQNAAQGAAADALASKMAALEAKGDAEAAANTAQTIVSNGAAAIATEVQPYLDAADASATSASASAFAALASQNAADASATNASNSASSAATSASNASSSASSASASATAAANSAATINPANFAPAVHTHTIANVTGLQTALDGKAASTHTHTIANVSGLQSALDAKIGDAPSNGNQYARQNGGWVINSSGIPDAPSNGMFYARYNGSWMSFDGSTKPADSLTQDAVYAAQNAEYVNYTGSISGSISTGSGSLTFTDSSGANGKYVATIAASMFSLVDYGSYWQLEIPTFNNTGSGYYAEDVANFVNGQGGNLTASFNGSYYTDATDNFAGSTVTMYKPTVGVVSGSRFVLKEGLLNYLQENAITASAPTNSVAFYNGSFMQWGSPWQLEGYVTSGTLSFYANLNVANSWTNKQSFPASNSTRASINVPHGSAPSSPTNGDVWSTTTGLQFRINSATRTAAMLEASNTFTAAAKQTMSHSTASAGLRVSPVASTVTSPVSGDVWHDSSTGVNQIFGFAGGVRGAMTAVRAFVNFNGTGTVAIRAGFNVSSITDNGVADYTVNFGTAMPDVNYTPVISSNWVVGTNANWAGQLGQHPTVAPTTTALRLQQTAIGDFTYCSVAVLR